jgi:pimeloyl-ACP methyl ester carboxylesterase
VAHPTRKIAPLRYRAGARRLVPWSALLVAALAGCGSGAPSVDRMVDVAGGQLDVWCDGGSGPAVVFLAAIGGDDTLLPIAERLADRADVCFYVRPGDGETRRPDAPRTAAKDASDLHELIGLAELERPIVLVAHSYGGLVAVVEAAEHPEEVAGVVLVDASHPAQETRFSAYFTGAQQQISDAEFASFPYVDFTASLADAGAAIDAFPDVPLTVITATHGFASACERGLPCEAMQSVWLGVQDEYATLTPDARHVLADTGHYVQDEDPDLVVGEIQAMLDRIAPVSPSPEAG